jgi:hypothetical protein
LDDKVSGTLVGLWLLIPEYLRLGGWDLLRGWCGKPTETVEPRLALQLVNEAALCVTGVRRQRSLSQQGFEIANGLPFVATDQAMHHLLNAHTVAEAEAFQVALGRLRRALGHFSGQTIAIDPHRMRSYSKRQMRRRKTHAADPTSLKTAQTFFCFDVETQQPIAFTTATAGQSVSQATPRLLQLTEQILKPRDPRPLVLADTEHFTAQLFEHVQQHTPFHLLAPMANRKGPSHKIQTLNPETFTPRWAGFATATLPYHFTHSSCLFHQIVQRCGETPADYRFKGFISTHPGEEVELLTLHYPQRWHVEEFFNANQALGWKRAGTLNLNIRYATMTFALLAQAAIHQLRQRLGDPYAHWEASHLARNLFAALDGDIRVRDDTIVVTYYNAPNPQRLRHHYERLPHKLQRDAINPRIPWLFDFKLDFRFK